MGRIVIFAPLKTEANSVSRLIHKKSNTEYKATGQVGRNKIVLQITGIGPLRARECSERVLLNLKDRSSQAKLNIDAVMIIGSCASLNHQTSEGDVILYSQCVSVAKDRPGIACPTRILEKVKKLLEEKGIHATQLIGVTSNRIAISKKEKLALASYGADIVDMESYEILKAAHQANIPAVVIRVISDSLDRDMPDFNRAMNSNGEILAFGLSRILVFSPIKAAKVYFASRRALNVLNTVMAAVLPHIDC